MKTKKRLKVFHGLVNYGTQSGLIAKELRNQGVEAISVTYFDAFKRQTDVELKHGGNIFQKIIRHSWNYFFLIRCFIKYNVFHFYYGTTLLPKQIDLPFYKIFGKKVIFHYLGGDVEQYVGNKTHYGYDAKLTNKKVIKRLTYETKYAALQFVCSPYYSRFVSNSVVIPLAIDISNYKPVEANKNHKLKVLHAPTNRRFKGSDYIAKAIKRIKNEGIEFEYKEVRGLTHELLKKEYTNCDIFIDQIIAGWYGTAAIEAMAYGKPTIAFINREYFNLINYAHEIPIISADKNTIYSELKELLTKDRDTLLKHGNISREFVNKNHNVKELVKTLKYYYENITKNN